MKRVIETERQRDRETDRERERRVIQSRLRPPAAPLHPPPEREREASVSFHLVIQRFNTQNLLTR